VKYNLFLPIVEIFKANKDKYNLLNSTILDIFEFILKENNKYLILHIVENYRDIFAPITYVETFKNLFLKYDQYTEPPNEELQDSTTSSATVSEKSIHESQDDYFKESGEKEEISTSFGSLTEEEDRQFKPLVIYKEEQEEKPILSPNSPEKKRLKRKISFNLKMNSVVPNSSSPNKEEEENIEPIPKRRRQTGPEEEEHSSNSENHTSSSGNKEQSNSKEKSNDTLTNQEEHENNKTNTTKQFKESEEAATTKQSKESEEAATPKQQTNKVNEIDSPILNGTSNRVVPTLIISPPSGLTETSKENQV